MEDVRAPGARWGAGRIRPIAAIAAVLVAAVVVWVLAGGDEKSGSSTSSGPEIVSVADLRALSDSRDRPVYWAGPRAGTRIELTDEPDGRVYVRYLDEDAAPGDPRPIFLTVGTYPSAGAQGTLRRAARGSDAKLHRLPRGGLALLSPASPSSAYLAYPGLKSQIEVYAPQPRRALELIRAGSIEPVG